MHSPFGVILKRGRSTERGHKSVSDELLKRSAGALDLPGHRFEESILERAGAFGVLCVRALE